MEKKNNIYTIPCNFGWNDAGNWLSLKYFNKTNVNGNIIKGDTVTINTTNSIILGNKKLFATVGIKEIVIVDTDDALLICAKNTVQDIKEIIDKLKNNRNELI